MKPRAISPDDVTDIVELADQIQEAASKCLHDQPMDIAVSALMSAIINMIASQDPSREEFTHYRNVLFDLFTKMLERKTKRDSESS